MKFSNLIAASSFAIFAAATHTITANPPAPTVTTISQCNTGNAYCCVNALLANVPVATSLLGLLGLAINPIDALIGLGCINIVLGDNCSQQALCCTDNEYNGLVSGDTHAQRQIFEEFQINVGCTNIFI